MNVVPYSVTPPNQFQFGPAIVPTSLTSIFSSTCSLNKAVVSNQSAFSVSFTIVDNSTNGISGAGAQIVPAISLAGNSVTVIDLGGIAANGGFSWQASAANALNGWIQGAN